MRDNGPTMTTSAQHPSSISLEWLLRLRWLTAAAQLLMLGIALRVLPGELEAAPLVVLVLFGVLSNLALHLRWVDFSRDALLGGVLCLDILLLTGMLYFSGGPANPFTVIYLVQVTLAAVLMPGRWAWGLAALATLAFGGLFFWHLPVHGLGHMGHGDGAFSLHLLGMWVAFGVTAALIAAFVGRITRALRQREEELATLRDLNARQARLASLTTLAAGVAHELGTPLGTIAVSAGELQRGARRLGVPGADLLSDADLIREQVERCRLILDQMAGRSGSLHGEDPVPLAWTAIEASLLEGLTEADRARIQMDLPPGSLVRIPAMGLIRALKALLRNALEATATPGRVRVLGRCEPEGWVVRVEDEGTGMSPEVLARAGEPFFSTKGAGGMGLGLFLARTFAEELGGELHLEARPSGGTVAAMRWTEFTVE